MLRINKLGLLVGIVIFSIQFASAQKPPLAEIAANFWKGHSVRYTIPDSSLYYFTICAEEFLLKGDTNRSIQSQIEIGSIYTSNANYNQAYDNYWDALILANEYGDQKLTAQINDGLGILFGLFKRDNEALEYHLKALDLCKGFIKEDSSNVASIVMVYHSLAIFYRERGDYQLAQMFLDSCILNKPDYGIGTSNSKFINAELAYLSYYLGDVEKAIVSLKELDSLFQATVPTYLVILYSMLGEIYYSIDDFDQSKEYYKKALALGQQYKSHVNYMPQIYKNLSDLYVKTGNNKQAYSFLKQYAHLNDSLFGARSLNNSSLLQIKDEFRLEQEKKAQLIESAKLAELEHKDKVWFLRNTLLWISLVFLVLISLITFFYLRHRHRVSRVILENKQHVQSEKNREVLEVKNKELTTSALQLIEKDELLLEIKEMLLKLSDSNPKVDLRPVLNKIKTNSNQDWKEFNARFTAVNDSFYAALKEKFPELTQRDHKLCALVKLNFSSKEMAQLLGISIESVHTSRYRLRKKMHLGKGDNLTEFMASL